MHAIAIILNLIVQLMILPSVIIKKNKYSLIENWMRLEKVEIPRQW